MVEKQLIKFIAASSEFDVNAFIAVGNCSYSPYMQSKLNGQLLEQHTNSQSHFRCN